MNAGDDRDDHGHHRADRHDRTLLRRVSSLPYQKMNEEVLVVDPRTREVHLLNATATRIWDLLEIPSTSAQLLAHLTEEFDAPVEALRADMTILLEELERKGLVGVDAGSLHGHDDDAPHAGATGSPE